MRNDLGGKAVAAVERITGNLRHASLIAQIPHLSVNFTVPLSGFIAKFAMLTGMLNLDGLGAPSEIPARTWFLVALVILSGLAALVAMMRTGIRTFWAPLESIVPRRWCMDRSAVWVRQGPPATAVVVQPCLSNTMPAAAIILRR